MGHFVIKWFAHPPSRDHPPSKDLCDGMGVTTALGDRYEGHLKMGVKDGEGLKRWSNGDFHDGSWRAGQQEGQENTQSLWSRNLKGNLVFYYPKRNDSYLEEFNLIPCLQIYISATTVSLAL